MQYMYIASDISLYDCTDNKKTWYKQFPKNVIVEELGLTDMCHVSNFSPVPMSTHHILFEQDG